METPALKGRRLRPLLALTRHGRWGVLVALLVFVAGLPVVWIKGQSEYRAEAVFQVSPNYQKNLTVDRELELQSNSQYREFVNHLSRSVVRHDVIERAVANLRHEGVNPCLPPETTRKCIERLQRTLIILPVPDTYMVRVSLFSNTPGEPDQVINAIMKVFLDTVRDEQIFGADDRAQVLAEQDRRLREEIVRMEAERVRLAGLLGLTTFAENINNPYDALLAQTRERHAQAAVELAQARTSLKAFETQREVPAWAGRSVLDMRLQDNGLQALRNEVIKRTEELNRTLAGIESAHPAAGPARDELREIQARLSAREAAFAREAGENVRARLVASVMQAEGVEQELARRVTDLESQASTYAERFRDAMRLTAEIRKREEERHAIRDRLNFVNTEKDAIGFVRLITPALPAIQPLGLGKTKMLLMLMVACAGLALVVPVAIEVLDPRVLETGDAEKTMGIPAAAWLVEIEDTATGLLAHDQIKRFAATLLRNRQRGGAGTFVFSSVQVGGGTTALLLKLAASLGRLGARVLVVDANSLTLSSTLGRGLPGLSDLLAGRVGLDADAVVSSLNHEGTELALVPFGQARDSGLQRVERLREALTHWSGRYDLVLLDAPPLLPSADAELLVDAAGQVFLVVEVPEVTKAQVQRARLQLARLDPEAVGLVVNRVPLARGPEALREQVVESVTGGRFRDFMSTSWLRLQIDILRVRWMRWRWWSRQPRR